MVINRLDFHDKDEQWDGRRTSPLITARQPLDIKLLMGADATNPTQYMLFGGYRACRTGDVMLLYRWYGSYDGQFLLRCEDRVQENGLSNDTKLWPSEWHDFLKLDEGACFRLGGRIWEKLSQRELEQLVASKVYSRS